MMEEALFRKKERDGMHFHSRNRSKKGMAGFVLSIIGVAVFLTLCIISAATKGTAGQAIGVAGLLLEAESVAAFVFSLQGLREKDVYTKLPFAGLLVSGSLFVFLFCLYIVGL